jgi:hypothetical protein
LTNPTTIAALIRGSIDVEFAATATALDTAAAALRADATKAEAAWQAQQPLLANSESGDYQRMILLREAATLAEHAAEHARKHEPAIPLL